MLEPGETARVLRAGTSPPTTLRGTVIHPGFKEGCWPGRKGTGKEVWVSGQRERKRVHTCVCVCARVHVVLKALARVVCVSVPAQRDTPPVTQRCPLVATDSSPAGLTQGLCTGWRQLQSEVDPHFAVLSVATVAVF